MCPQCVCVRECVRACVRLCACVRACVCACVCACVSACERACASERFKASSLLVCKPKYMSMQNLLGNSFVAANRFDFADTKLSPVFAVTEMTLLLQNRLPFLQLQK